MICFALAGLSCGGSGGGDGGDGGDGFPTTYVSNKVLAPDAQAEDNFGVSVGIGKNLTTEYLAIVGAYREDQGGLNAGAAYLHLY
ncbi:MAG: FG-GAP repeat protein [Deltaproteobacteria bacterium]|nr:FG-GAP repeat protein [Deltaproteobacteria bacterium]